MTARNFADTTSQHLLHNAAVAGTLPITFACWFKSDDGTTAQTLMAVGSNSSLNYLALQARGDSGGDPLNVILRSPSGIDAAATTSGFTPGTWHHAMGVFEDNGGSDLTVYIDGSNMGTSSLPGKAAPTGMDRTYIGVTDVGAGLLRYMSGAIAYPAIYNAALTAADAALFYAGMPACRVRPDALVAWWPLINNDSDRDWWGGSDLTAVNSPTYAADGPPMRAMRSPRVLTPRQSRGGIFGSSIIGTAGQPAQGGVIGSTRIVPVRGR